MKTNRLRLLLGILCIFTLPVKAANQVSFSYQGKQLKPGDTLRKTSVIDFKLGNGKL